MAPCPVYYIEKALCFTSTTLFFTNLTGPLRTRPPVRDNVGLSTRVIIKTKTAFHHGSYDDCDTSTLRGRCNLLCHIEASKKDDTLRRVSLATSSR